jgi:hypothetical protein
MAKKESVMQKTAFAELTACKCWPMAEARLREGASARAVAEYVHSMGDMTHLKVSSLTRQLQRYRQRVLQPRKTLSPTYIDQAMQRLDLAFDDVEELTKVVLIQKQRVSKDLKLEENMPKLAPWLMKEVQLLFDMIERRAKLLQTLGILYKAPDKRMVAVLGDDTWARLLDTLDPHQRAQAREIIQMEYAAVREEQTVAEQERRGMLQVKEERSGEPD